jgi:hypothetical protein
MKKIVTWLITCTAPIALAIFPATACSSLAASNDTGAMKAIRVAPDGKSAMKAYKDGCKSAPASAGQKGRVLAVAARYVPSATISFSFVADGYSDNDATTQGSYYGITTDNGKQLYQALLTAYQTGSDVWLSCSGDGWVSGVWVGK